jgi:hypothetical protein
MLYYSGGNKDDDKKASDEFSLVSIATGHLSHAFDVVCHVVSPAMSFFYWGFLVQELRVIH